MRFVIFGLTITSTWGNGHATLWRGLCRALVRAGHSTVFFEKDVPYYANARDLHALHGVDIVLYSEWDEIRSRARRELAHADAAIVTSYCPDGIAASELMLEHSRGLRVFYDLDTPVTLARLDYGESLNYIGPRGLADFDLVLSFTGGGALDALRHRLGAKRVLPLYGHVDPDTHHPVPAEARYLADLSYLGTYAADRQAALDAFFIAAARVQPSRRFVMGGAQYPTDFPWTDNIFFVRHLPVCEHPAFFCSSRFTLNITRQAMARMGWCPSGRLFEAAACGAALISDDWESLDAFFAAGEEIVVAHNTQDVVNALEMSEGEIKRMAAAARERTLAEHTSERRAREMIAALESLRAPTPAARIEA
jgi:spore maturation protein CgeB